jgi:hypothetical protein
MVGGVFLAVLLNGGLLQASQAFRTPGEYLASRQWSEKTRGPLLYLPNREQQVRDNSPEEAGFGIFACGSLHVIAPAYMTVIDPVYLASTFTESQWQTACTTGIGLGDLNRDQQATYRSILPAVFKYQTSQVRDPNGNNGSRGASTQTTLTPDEESQVRLQIYKEMTLGVQLSDGGSSAISAQTWHRHKPGEKISRRIDDVAEDKNFAFGIEIRKTLPNESKPSDLDYKASAYDTAFPLTPSSSVKDLCQTASELIHRTVIPDARFQNLQVATVGSSARCGDVLKGLALCLTGTYRKVGNIYVLTSDVEGIGTKMTKLAFWHWNLTQIEQKESETWKSKISANRGIRSIAYAANDGLTPNDAMRNFMDSDFEQGDKTMPASGLSPAWSQLLNGKDNHFASPLRTDVAEPWDSVFWSFVTPAGEPLGWESELGDLNEFTHHIDRQSARARQQELKRFELGSLPGSALVYQSDDPEFASKLPKLAKTQGFTELWLQTTKSRALSAAVQRGKAAGIPVRLVVEPFAALGDPPKDQIDRTILDYSYSQAESLVDGSDWVETLNQVFSANERAVDFVDESSPSLAGYWKLLNGLASSPGLSGAVVLSVTPVGYEEQSDWPEYEPPQLGAPLMLGYTTGLRQKFLLANSVDPVDLLEVRDQFDLQPLEQTISSFGDLNAYPYGKVAENPLSYRDKWDRMRFESNEDRLKQFESNLSTPFLIEWRRKLHDTSLNWDGVVSPLTGEAPADTLKDNPYQQTLPVDAYYLPKVGYPLSEGVTARVLRRMSARMKKQLTKFAIDLRAVPADQLAQTLKLLFVP